MTNWYYYDTNGNKIAIPSAALRALAQSGVITPETKIETEDGRVSVAGKINGLEFVEPQIVEPVQRVVSPSPMSVQTSFPEQSVLPPPLPSVATTSASIPDLLKRAKSGDIAAMRKLSIAYLEGEGVDQDGKLSEQWLEKAAKLGDAESQGDMADLLRIDTSYRDSDFNKAFYWEQKAAEQGRPQSQYNLGVSFRDGIGTPVNPEKQFFWYRKAAENGLTNAKTSLAICYLMGVGTPQNIQQALHYLQEASDEGDAEAKRRLGVAYIEGIGCSVDVKRGLDLLHESASLGNEKAKEILLSDDIRSITNIADTIGGESTDLKSQLKKSFLFMIIGGLVGGIVAVMGGGAATVGVLIGAYLGIGIEPFKDAVIAEMGLCGWLLGNLLKYISNEENLFTFWVSLIILVFWIPLKLGIALLISPVIAIYRLLN